MAAIAQADPIKTPRAHRRACFCPPILTGERVYYGADHRCRRWIFFNLASRAERSRRRSRSAFSEEKYMSETTELAEKLRSVGDKIVSTFRGLADEQWNREVYTEGTTWTIRNILSHFVTSERGLLKLFEQIRQGGPGSSEEFSIDRYNANMQARTKDLTPQELLEQYKSIRADSIPWTSSLSETDLEIQGRHPFLGMTTIREMIKMLYLHNQLHYRDMKKVLK